MYKIYILQSFKNNRYYIGYTSDLKSRLLSHNLGNVRSTKSSMPWKIIYTEDYHTKTEAIKREKEIKKYKGGIQFKMLLQINNS